MPATAHFACGYVPTVERSFLCSIFNISPFLSTQPSVLNADIFWKKKILPMHHLHRTSCEQNQRIDKRRKLPSMVFGILLIICSALMLITCFVSIGKDPGYAIALALFTTAMTLASGIFLLTCRPPEDIQKKNPSYMYVHLYSD